MSCIADISSSIFLELDQPENISIPAIANWIRGAVKSGKLSNIILSDYDIVDDEISPELSVGGEDILKLLYKIYFFEKLVISNLSQASLNSIQSFKEGNRSVTRFNKNEIAKTYKDMLKELKNDLKDAVVGYQNKQLNPAQIAVYNQNLIRDYNCDFCQNFGCDRCNYP